MILQGVEGIGKSSFGAESPHPYFMMAKGETGIETLIDSGQVGETPHSPELMEWEDVLSILTELRDSDHKYKTIVLDALGGFERLCHEYVCKTMFGSKWGKDGFASFQQGYDASLSEWRVFLGMLDQIRAAKKMAILILSHVKVKAFKNPEGADYDRYTSDLHDKTWGLTHKWADIVIFANFYTVVDEQGSRAKGKGGAHRLMFTQRTAAYDAKNRHGLPEEIEMGTSAKEAWSNFMTAMKGGAK